MKLSLSTMRQVAQLYQWTNSVLVEQDSEFTLFEALVPGVMGDCRIRLWVNPDGETDSIETQAVHPLEPNEYFPLVYEDSMAVATGRAALGGLRVGEDDDGETTPLKVYRGVG